MSADNYVHDGINDFYDAPQNDTTILPQGFKVGDPIMVGRMPAIALSSRTNVQRQLAAGWRVSYTTSGRFTMSVDATAAITFGALIYFQLAATRGTHLESLATATNRVWGISLGAGATGAARTIGVLVGDLGGAILA